MKEPNPVRPVQAVLPVRLISLSDGLFATVMTLLVLDLRTPASLGNGGSDPVAFIRSIAPHLFSYLLTFFVAAAYWFAHHRDFDHIIGYDRTLLGYNLLFLLFVGLFPFTTATVSLGGFNGAQYPFYWAVYSVNIALAGIMLTLTWLYAVSHGQTDPALTSAERRHLVATQSVTPGMFLVSMAIQYAFQRAIVGPLVLVLIPFAQWLVDRWLPSTEAEPRRGRVTWSERLWKAGTTLIWLLLIALAIWASGF